ncbi:MAG: L17 family ribosomal protein [Pirellulaceae bacterium]
MRHRKRGRRLGRSSSHRRAMLRNLACSLFLSEADSELDPNPPKVKGRVTTTLQKAKEVRPLVEKCITIARRSLEHEEAARPYAVDAERGSAEYRQWRASSQWQDWSNARAPAVAARRRVLRLLGNKRAVSVLFDEIAPRFIDRDGGYTRVLRLAKPRLGDAGTRAILEFSGQHDRVSETSERPAFEDADLEDEGGLEEKADEEEVAQEQEAGDQRAEDQDASTDTDSREALASGEEATSPEDEKKADA